MILYLMVEVDTNDSDYDCKSTEVSATDTEDLCIFKEVLKLLPTEDNYHYRDGVKVVTGKKIRFENSVGYDSINGSCGLKDLVLSDSTFIKEEWTVSEARDEGFLNHWEYLVLEKYLPMYIDGGFHSIIRVWFEERQAPIFVEEVNL